MIEERTLILGVGILGIVTIVFRLALFLVEAHGDDQGEGKESSVINHP